MILHSKKLIAEFGSDVTLKTDFETLLPRNDDNPSLLALRHSIYHALTKTTRFLQAKQPGNKAVESPLPVAGKLAGLVTLFVG